MIVRVGIVLVLVLALVGVILLFNRGSGTDGSQAQRMVDSGALLLDVRARKEFATGHIPNALNVPVQELPERLDELGSKEDGIVVYCRSGARSARAEQILRKAGYRVVHDLGAMGNWK